MIIRIPEFYFLLSCSEMSGHNAQGDGDSLDSCKWLQQSEQTEPREGWQGVEWSGCGLAIT